MTGLLKQRLVDDDAERLVAIAGAVGFAVLALDVEVLGGHLVEEIGAVERQAVFLPGVQAGLVAALEQGGSAVLRHFGGEGLAVGAGSCGDDLDGHAGQLGVLSSQFLPGSVCFGLEVQVVDLTLGSRGSGFVGCVRSGRGGSVGLRSLGGGFCIVLGAASEQAGDHGQSKQKRDEFLHFQFLLV